MGEGKISAGKEKVRSAHCGGGHVVWQSSSRNPPAGCSETFEQLDRKDDDKRDEHNT